MFRSIRIFHNILDLKKNYFSLQLVFEDSWKI